MSLYIEYNKTSMKRLLIDFIKNRSSRDVFNYNSTDKYLFLDYHTIYCFSCYKINYLKHLKEIFFSIRKKKLKEGEMDIYLHFKSFSLATIFVAIYY